MHYVGFRQGWVHPAKLRLAGTLPDAIREAALDEWEALGDEREAIEAFERARVQAYLDTHPDAGRCISSHVCEAKAKHTVEAVRDPVEAEKL